MYAADGKLLGEIRTPEFFPDVAYGDGFLGRLTADDLDVQQIVVYRRVEDGAGA